MRYEVEMIKKEIEQMIELGTDESVFGNYKDVLANAETALKILEELAIDDLTYSLEKTSGGSTGYGCSILIKADGSEVYDQVVAKVSDHNNYESNLFIYDFSTKEDIEKILNEEDIRVELGI